MFFFFNDTATTEIYTLSLHDALPICLRPPRRGGPHVDARLRQHARVQPRRAPLAAARPSGRAARQPRPLLRHALAGARPRSEEHTSELQSRQYLVCRLLLEKKKNNE